MIQIDSKELTRMIGDLFHAYASAHRTDATNDFTDMLSRHLRDREIVQDDPAPTRPASIRYEYEFDFEENFRVRFNYIPGCQGDAWTPDDPEEVEIVQVLFFGEPLTVNQENAFKDTNTEQLEEACWSRMDEDEGPLPYYEPAFY